MRTYEHTGNTYEIRCRFFAFSNNYDVIDICFTKKDANDVVKMAQRQPRYECCRFEIVQTMKNWKRIN